jgi:hypothetical protein
MERPGGVNKNRSPLALATASTHRLSSGLQGEPCNAAGSHMASSSIENDAVHGGAVHANKGPKVQEGAPAVRRLPGAARVVEIARMAVPASSAGRNRPTA